MKKVILYCIFHIGYTEKIQPKSDRKYIQIFTLIALTSSNSRAFSLRIVLMTVPFIAILYRKLPSDRGV